VTPSSRGKERVENRGHDKELRGRSPQKISPPTGGKEGRKTGEGVGGDAGAGAGAAQKRKCWRGKKTLRKNVNRAPGPMRTGRKGEGSLKKQNDQDEEMVLARRGRKKKSRKDRSKKDVSKRLKGREMQTKQQKAESSARNHFRGYTFRGPECQGALRKGLGLYEGG